LAFGQLLAMKKHTKQKKTSITKIDEALRQKYKTIYQIQKSNTKCLKGRANNIKEAC
jgi:hypothetical protein